VAGVKCHEAVSSKGRTYHLKLQQISSVEGKAGMQETKQGAHFPAMKSEEGKNREAHVCVRQKKREGLEKKKLTGSERRGTTLFTKKKGGRKGMLTTSRERQV